MMKVLYYIFFSIASLISKRAMLGKWNVSCTLLYILIYLQFIGIYTNLIQFLHFRPENPKLFAILIYGGMGVFLFIYLRIVILKPAKLIQMRKEFNKIPKWKLKLTGILFIVFSYIVGIGLGIVSTKM